MHFSLVLLCGFVHFDNYSWVDISRSWKDVLESYECASGWQKPPSQLATSEMLYEGFLRAVLDLWKVKMYPFAVVIESVNWKPPGIWENAWKVGDPKFY